MKHEVSDEKDADGGTRDCTPETVQLVDAFWQRRQCMGIARRGGGTGV
jgi:hypothetical protein